ncbi:MAG: alpha/beta fold hydrolase [Candidatus Velthaea sp.]
MQRVIVAALSVALSSSRAVPAAAHPPLAAVGAALDRVRAFDQVALAPDGRRVAWTEAVSGPRGAENHEAIFMAEVARGERSARRVTGCPGATCNDAAIAWSPDSRMLAFLTTDASGQAQLAIAPAARGAARRLTAHLHGPLADPKWSPDGRTVAVLYTKDAPKTPGPLNPAARDAGVVGSTFYEQRIAVASLAGAPLRVVSPPDLYVYEYDWSPDGRTFAATGAHGNGDANWWTADLFAIRTDGRDAHEIHHPALQIASPRWSGDGSSIAYIGGIMSDESITGGDVFVVPAAGGTARNVTPDLKASITTLTWNGSPSTLTVTELSGGRMAIATIDVNAGTHRVRWSGEQTIFASSLGSGIPGDAGISLARDGKTSALVRQSFTSPPELYAGPVGGWKQFTARNASTPRAIARARSLAWRSDAFDVQGWLIYPDGYVPGRRYPLVVIVHGGPAYANYPEYPSGAFAFDAFLASQGYFVLEPNPRGSYGQGEAFTQANVKDFGGGDLRDILAGVNAAERTAPIDDRRLGIFGWSYGGYMTMWALTQTTRFRAAVSGAGLSDWLSYYGTNDIDTWMIPYFGASVYDDPAVYAKSSPINFIKAVRTPTLLVAGDRDAEVPITQSYEYWHALKSLGVPTQLVLYPDEGHLFHKSANQADVARRLVRWFDRWLAP